MKRLLSALLLLLCALLALAAPRPTRAANPAPPALTELGTISGSFAWSAVIGNHAYLGDLVSPGVQTFDISDPANPVLRSYTLSDTLDSVESHLVADGRLFVTTPNALHELDLSDPARPAIAQTIGGLPARLRHPALVGDYLYLLASTPGASGGETSDLLALHLPTRVVTVTDTDNPDCGGLAARDNLLLVTCVDNYARIHSLDDPARPLLIEHVSATHSDCPALLLEPPYLFIHDSGDGVTRVYDLSTLPEATYLDYIPTETGEGRRAALLRWGDSLLRMGTLVYPDADLVRAFPFAAPVPAPDPLTLAAPDCREPQIVGSRLYTVDGQRFRILQSAGILHTQYLPVVGRDTCPAFMEDFSDRSRGWQEGGIFALEYGYTNDEYLLRLLGAGFVADVPAPLPCATPNVNASVTGRWLDEAGAGFGITFGSALSPTLTYTFDVNPDARTYRVLQRVPGGITTFIPDTPTDALTPGAPARLNVRIRNRVVLLSVNGAPLEEFDFPYEGNITLGLSIAARPDQPDLPLEARFDDVWALWE